MNIWPIILLSLRFKEIVSCVKPSLTKNADIERSIYFKNFKWSPSNKTRNGEKILCYTYRKNCRLLVTEWTYFAFILSSVKLFQQEKLWWKGLQKDLVRKAELQKILSHKSLPLLLINIMSGTCKYLCLITCCGVIVCMYNTPQPATDINCMQCSICTYFLSL